MKGGAKVLCNNCSSPMSLKLYKGAYQLGFDHFESCMKCGFDCKKGYEYYYCGNCRKDFVDRHEKRKEEDAKDRLLLEKIIEFNDYYNKVDLHLGEICSTGGKFYPTQERLGDKTIRNKIIDQFVNSLKNTLFEGGSLGDICLKLYQEAYDGTGNEEPRESPWQTNSGLVKKEYDNWKRAVVLNHYEDLEGTSWEDLNSKGLEKGLYEWINNWWTKEICYVGCNKCYPTDKSFTVGPKGSQTGMDRQSGNVTNLRNRPIRKSESLHQAKPGKQLNPPNWDGKAVDIIKQLRKVAEQQKDFQAKRRAERQALPSVKEVKKSRSSSKPRASSPRSPITLDRPPSSPKRTSSRAGMKKKGRKKRDKSRRKKKR